MNLISPWALESINILKDISGMFGRSNSKKECKCVGIFPSGTRTNEEVLMKKRVVTIIIKSKSSLVPAAYTGPSKILVFFKGEKSMIIIGKPIPVNPELEKDELIDATLVELDNVNEKFG